jgi:hypothetical protein
VTTTIAEIVASAAAAAVVIATVVTAIVVIAAIANGARGVKKAQPKEEHSDVDRSPSPLLSPPQELPILRPERAEDRLQGYAALIALHFRARQDRALAHHRRVRQEAARACACNQAGAFSWSVALRDPLKHKTKRFDKRPPDDPAARLAVKRLTASAGQLE